MSLLETEAIEVETKLQSSLKILGVIGAGLIAATIIYKLTQPESPKKKQKTDLVNKSNGGPSPITASVISMALQKLIPLALNKFSNLNSKNQKNEKAAK